MPSDTETVTLNPTVLEGYETTYLKNPNGLVMAMCQVARCTYGYGVDDNGGSELSDSDTATGGFQVDLDRGVNKLGLGVDKGIRPGGFELYFLTVTVQNASATGQPAITGTEQVSQELTADTLAIDDEDGLDNVEYSYQWIRVASDSTETDIPSATGPTYTLTSDDAGKTIKVRVEFTDDAGYEETLTSEATETVVAGGL